MRANFVLSGVALGMRRNLSMTVALVLSTAIALSFVGAALLANTEASKFKVKYVNKINVSVYLCSTEFQPPCTHKTTPAEQAAIQSALDSDPTVRSVSFVNEDQAYELGKAQGPGVARYLKPGVLPASYTVKLKNIKQDYPAFEARYSKMPGVNLVQNAIDVINTLLSVIDSVRWFSLFIAFIVLIASILLIANTIQVAAAQRRNETSIMRLVGASRWMTELPFMIETVIATAVGGILALVAIWVGEHIVLDEVFKGPTENGVIPGLSTNDVLKAGGVGLIVGVVLAAITAFGTLRLRVRL